APSVSALRLGEGDDSKKSHHALGASAVRFKLPMVFDEICLQSIEAARCVRSVSQFLLPLPVGHLDRIYAGRDVGKNARNIDTAFADVKAGVANDAYHLGAPRRYLGTGIAEMGEMEPLARQCVEVCRVVTGPMEVVHIDHQACVGPVDSTQHIDRLS